MNHQKLHCYKKLLMVTKTMQKSMPTWGRRHHALADQMQRAAMSAVLNLAEGNSKTTPKDRAKFFRISAGSVAELSAALDLVVIFFPADALVTQDLQNELAHAYAMICRLP